MKKTGMMSGMQIQHGGHSLSFTVVIVIASIFLFVTIAVTMALVVFCRKRNAVFAFQKSEQEDYPDYEMEEMETDVEYNTETDSDTETSSLRKQRRPKSCRCQHSGEGSARGDYQMVVTALVDNPGGENCSLVRPKHAEKRFYGLTNMPPEVFQNQRHHPEVNITYTDAAMASRNPSTMYTVVVTMDNPKSYLRSSRSDCNIRYHMAPQDTSPKTVTATASKHPLYVNLPRTDPDLSGDYKCDKTVAEVPGASSAGAAQGPATMFMATGAERLGRMGSIRSLSREQCLSMLSLRSNCPTQVSDGSHLPINFDEQESLLEEYFLTNYAEDEMFSD
jgi:hypothetical protein